jgi:hypothetical protein
MYKSYLGNIKIMDLSKLAFLCSRHVPASVVLKCYDWAIEQRESGRCVISGFHSQIERDVYHYLEKGTQPIIISMARGIPNKLPEALKKQVDKERLLILSPFDKNVTKVTNETAIIRNRMMIEIADEVCVGYASPKGNLVKVLKRSLKTMYYIENQ